MSLVQAGILALAMLTDLAACAGLTNYATGATLSYSAGTT